MRNLGLPNRAIGKKGDLGQIAIGVVIFFMIAAIGNMLLLYLRSTLSTSLGLNATDNASLHTFVTALLGLFNMFILIGMVVMGGIAIFSLRSFGGGGRAG